MCSLDEGRNTITVHLAGAVPNHQVLLLRVVVDVSLLARNGHICKFASPFSVEGTCFVYIAAIPLQAFL